MRSAGHHPHGGSCTFLLIECLRTLNNSSACAASTGLAARAFATNASAVSVMRCPPAWKGLPRQAACSASFLTCVFEGSHGLAIPPCGAHWRRGGDTADATSALEGVSAATRFGVKAQQPRPGCGWPQGEEESGELPQILEVYGRPPQPCHPSRSSDGWAINRPRGPCDGLADVTRVLCPMDDRGLDSVPVLTEVAPVATAATDSPAAPAHLFPADLACPRGQPPGPCALLQPQPETKRTSPYEPPLEGI